MSRSRDPVVNANVENILSWDRHLDELDYFELLNVDERATEEQLHAAYLRFARTFHPDVHPHADEPLRAALTRIFQRGVEAHQSLSDRNTLQLYLRLRARGERRMRDGRVGVPLDLEQELPKLHEHCRSAGAKLEAQQAAVAHRKGNVAEVKRRLLSALRYDGDANPDIERCLVALQH